jgi:hypothetical protein
MPRETPEPSTTNNRYLLIKYGGLAMQWLIVLLLTVLGGKKIDQWLKFKKPIFIWILPVIGIIGLLYVVIKDTSPSKNK